MKLLPRKIMIQHILKEKAKNTSLVDGWSKIYRKYNTKNT
jgi:hypothetical protein